MSFPIRGTTDHWRVMKGSKRARNAKQDARVFALTFFLPPGMYLLRVSGAQAELMEAKE